MSMDDIRIEYADYKGSPTMAFHKLLPARGDQPAKEYRQLSFGVKKAQMILAHLEEIQAFIDEHSASDGGE